MKTTIVFPAKPSASSSASNAPSERSTRDVTATIGQMDIDHPRLLSDPRWRANAERALLDAFFGVLAAATLVELPELGHAPQVEAPEAFHRALLGGLSSQGR